jgi:hypothetical protein
VEDAVVYVDPAAAGKRRAAAVAARRVRSWPEGDGSAVLAVHAGDADIALADQVINDLARAYPGTDPNGVRLTMDQRRTDALIGLFRTVRDGSLADPSAGSAFRISPGDGSGAVEQVVRLDRSASDACNSREALVSAVRQKLAAQPELETDGHDPTEAITRHVRAAAPTCSFYDCPRQARSCDLDHDTPWPRGPTSISNLDPKCRRHHNAKTLGVVRTSLNAGPGAGPRTVHWTLPGGITVTTSTEPLPGTRIRPTPAPLAG